MPNTDMGGFTDIDAKSIKSQKLTLNFLILKQLDRLNYSFSLQRANCNNPERGDFEVAQLARGIKNGLGTIEALASPMLSPKYLIKSQTVKQKIDDTIGGAHSYSEVLFDNLLEWYKLLVRELGAFGLIPLREMEEVYD